MSKRVSQFTRIVLGVDSAAFLISAFLNWGLQIPLGFMTIAFAPRVWQAGIGEAVVGVSLGIAAATGRRTIAWIALVLSALGIAFGLISRAVQGPARAVHVILVPLAVLLLVLLLVDGRSGAAGRDARAR